MGTVPSLPPWPDSPEALVAAQDELGKARPELWRPGAAPATIASAYVCFPRRSHGTGQAGDPAWIGAVVVREREVIAEAVVRARAGAAYQPGLLALREGPGLEAALRELPRADVLLIDATGRDHPRRAGVALHLGARLEIASVGVTHRPLVATGDEPDDRRGATSPLVLDGEVVGAWVRVAKGVRPLAAHAGWRTDPATAVEIVLRATKRWRTPRPLREARRLARVARAEDTVG